METPIFLLVLIFIVIFVGIVTLLLRYLNGEPLIAPTNEPKGNREFVGENDHNQKLIYVYRLEIGEWMKNNKHIKIVSIGLLENYFYILYEEK